MARTLHPRTIAMETKRTNVEGEIFQIFMFSSRDAPPPILAELGHWRETAELPFLSLDEKGRKWLTLATIRSS